MDTEDEIKDVKEMLMNHRLDYLEAENEDLKETVRMRNEQLEEKSEKIEELESQLQYHQKETPHSIVQSYSNMLGYEQSKLRKLMMDNEDLEKRNEEISPENLMKELKAENGALREEMLSLVNLKAENNSLKMKLEELLKNNEDSEENFGLAKSMEKLRAENEDLKIALNMKEELIEEKSEKIGALEKKLQDQQEANLHLIQINSGLMAYKGVDILEELKKKNEEIEKLNAVLEEKSAENLHEKSSSFEKLKRENLEKVAYKEEVERLKRTKEKVVKCCSSLSKKCYEFVGLSISSLKALNSTENAKELIRLEEELKKVNDEWWWWITYSCFNSRITSDFNAIQHMNKNPDYVYSSYRWREFLKEDKKDFDEKSDYLKKRMEGKEWIKDEISTGEKYLKKWQELVKEAAAKEMNKAVFAAIQDMNENPDSVDSFNKSRGVLKWYKRNFDPKSDCLMRRAEGKEWIEDEISIGKQYFEKLEKLVEEAAKRMNIFTLLGSVLNLGSP